jgi:signal peptidase II
MRTRGEWLALLALVATTIACDRATKVLAVQELAQSPSRSYLADTLRLGYVENRGGFLGLGAQLPAWARRSVFIAGTGIVLGGLALALVRRRFGMRPTAGLGLVWAGGASNLYDRLVRDSVVDFMNVGLGPLRTGIFNVADMAITLGIALLLIWHREAHKP